MLRGIVLSDFLHFCCATTIRTWFVSLLTQALNSYVLVAWTEGVALINRKIRTPSVRATRLTRAKVLFAGALTGYSFSKPLGYIPPR